ncbi:MAG: hypothetical protein V9G19_14855 [Tetrasphaera sp.]
MAGGTLLHAWVFGPVVITVGYWEQIGTRPRSARGWKIRRVEPEPVPGPTRVSRGSGCCP